MGITKPRMVKVVSNNKVCPRCILFCMEVKPFFPARGAALYFAEGGRLPETKVFCQNCSNKNLPNGEEWGWIDVTDPSLANLHLEADLKNIRRRS